MFNPLDYPIAFAVPGRGATHPPSAWLSHVPFGMTTIGVLRPRVVVELGTFTGVSYCAFCQAVAQLATGSRCFAVDTWRGDAHTGPADAGIVDDLRAHHDARYGSFSTLLQSTFDDALSYFADGTIDLLHIDGYHTYEAVRHDFEQWLPKLSERGVVLIHDIDVRMGDFGVWRLWGELQGCYPHLAFSHGFGLGVLAVGEHVPPPFLELLTADQYEVHRLRTFFFDLGQRLVERFESQRRAQEIAAAHGRLVHNLTAQVADMEHAVQQQAMRLTEKDAALAAKDRALAEEQQTAERLRATLAAAEEDWREVSAERATLREALAAAEGDGRNLARRLALIDQRLSWQALHGAWQLQSWVAPPNTPQGRALIAGTAMARRMLGRPLLPGVHIPQAVAAPLPAVEPPRAEPAPTLAPVREDDTNSAMQPELPFESASAPDELTRYRDWVRRSAQILYSGDSVRSDIAGLRRRPRISIVMPVYDTEPADLRAALDSVATQYYPDWELCLCDDASSAPHVREILRAYAERDPRIRVTFAERNGGIAMASNRALTLATGEYIALMDHDDLISPDALYAVALALQDDDADIIYSDNDCITPEGERLWPLYKPAWCPNLFLSVMYTCHFSVYRRALIDAVDGFSPGFDGGQDLEMVLRFLNNVRRVVHIPRVLYSWRLAAGSAARSIDAKPYAYNAVRRALDEYMRRQTIPGEASFDRSIGYYHARRAIVRPGKVTIAIPVCDQLEQVRRCVASIEAHTDYRDYSILLIDGGSRERATLDYLERSPHHVSRAGAPFNTGRLYNLAATVADGEYLLLFDSACEPVGANWLTALVEQGQRPEVGAVGAKLLDEDGRVHHAGIVLTTKRIASYSHQGFDSQQDLGFLNTINIVRDYSAVSGACLLIRRDLYREIGGLDEAELSTAFADVDLCLRLRQRGLAVVFTPFATLRQGHSTTRTWDGRPDDQPDPRATAYMRRHWGPSLADDPCYSPNMTHRDQLFGIDFDKPEGTHYLYESSTGERTVGRLVPGRIISQGFVAPEDGLCGVSVQFATHNRRCVGTVHVRLHERGKEADALIADIDATEIVDNFYHIVAFAPIAGSAGRAYRLSVEFAAPRSDNELTIWATAATDPVAGPYQDNGIPQYGTLAFNAFAAGPAFRLVADNVPMALAAWTLVAGT